jgi:Na+/H+-dicarboxylate symporter
MTPTTTPLLSQSGHAGLRALALAAGLHFSIGQQIVLLAVAGSFQIPTSAVLMLLGVDTLMDMGRTAMNVIGNCMAAAVVARWEGELKPGAISV